MKSILFLSRFCLLALSLILAGTRTHAQGTLTLTNIDGVPIYVWMPSNTNAVPVIVGTPNPNSTNGQISVELPGGTNLNVGGPILLQPSTNILVIGTNVIQVPPIVMLPPSLDVRTVTNWHRITFVWLSTLGVKYQIQASRDQLHWLTLRTINGTGRIISIGNFPLHWRLHYRVVIASSRWGLTNPRL